MADVAALQAESQRVIAQLRQGHDDLLISATNKGVKPMLFAWSQLDGSAALLAKRMSETSTAFPKYDITGRPPFAKMPVHAGADGPITLSPDVRGTEHWKSEHQTAFEPSEEAKEGGVAEGSDLAGWKHGQAAVNAPAFFAWQRLGGYPPIPPPEQEQVEGEAAAVAAAGVEGEAAAEEKEDATMQAVAAGKVVGRKAGNAAFDPFGADASSHPVQAWQSINATSFLPPNPPLHPSLEGGGGGAAGFTHAPNSQMPVFFAWTNEFSNKPVQGSIYSTSYMPLPPPPPPSSSSSANAQPAAVHDMSEVFKYANIGATTSSEYASAFVSPLPPAPAAAAADDVAAVAPPTSSSNAAPTATSSEQQTNEAPPVVTFETPATQAPPAVEADVPTPTLLSASASAQEVVETYVPSNPQIHKQLSNVMQHHNAAQLYSKSVFPPPPPPTSFVDTHSFTQIQRGLEGDVIVGEQVPYLQQLQQEEVQHSAPALPDMAIQEHKFDEAAVQTEPQAQASVKAPFKPVTEYKANFGWQGDLTQRGGGAGYSKGGGSWSEQPSNRDLTAGTMQGTPLTPAADVSLTHLVKGASKQVMQTENQAVFKWPTKSDFLNNKHAFKMKGEPIGRASLWVCGTKGPLPEVPMEVAAGPEASQHTQTNTRTDKQIQTGELVEAPATRPPTADRLYSLGAPMPGQIPALRDDTPPYHAPPPPPPPLRYTRPQPPNPLPFPNALNPAAGFSREPIAPAAHHYRASIDPTTLYKRYPVLNDKQSNRWSTESKDQYVVNRKRTL